MEINNTIITMEMFNELQEKVLKYETQRKNHSKLCMKWMRNNKECINKIQRTYYKNHLKGNDEYLSKKREYMRELNIRKMLEDETYLDTKRKKARDRARMIALKKKQLLLNTVEHMEICL
jgi:hypothetical protein